MTGERLAREIKSLSIRESDMSDLVYGQVTSISPLKIRIDNRFEISGTFIELSQLVKNLVITITIDGKSGSARIFRDLMVGDRVRMLRAQKSQKYYVLERV